MVVPRARHYLHRDRKRTIEGDRHDDRGGAGEERISKLSSVNGYTLTAQTAVLIAEKILANNFKTGYQTPAMAYGPDLILEIPDTTRTDN